MGVNLKEEEKENLDQGEEESVEKGDGGQDNLEKKVEVEEVEEVEDGEEKVSNVNNFLPPEAACAGEHPVETAINSEIKEKVHEEPEEEKLGQVVDDEALGADWGLVINQTDAIEKPSGGVNLGVDGEVVPCEEPMEVVEDEAVPDIIEKKEESVNQENEL